MEPSKKTPEGASTVVYSPANKKLFKLVKTYTVLT